MSEWSQLPNAAHIDRILAHLKTHSKKWTVTGDAAYIAILSVSPAWAQNVAWKAAYNAAWDASRTAAYDDSWTEARNAASGAILALILNDACAYLLKEKLEHVKLLASLGQSEAILLLPAVRAMSHG
jgi:hypothetical protein